jgi:hypothetical protein
MSIWAVSNSIAALTVADVRPTPARLIHLAP